jgi:antitoxin StbD
MALPRDTAPSVSLSEFNEDPLAILSTGNGGPVAVIDEGQPAFYCLSPAAYEAIQECLDDRELAQLVESRLSEVSIPVNMDDL